jgi:hypothetical protein
MTAASTALRPRTMSRDAIKGALDPAAVLRWFGIQGHAVGREFRTNACPECGVRTRDDAVSVNLDNGLWHCFVRGCRGDLFDLAGALDGAAGFQAVLEVCTRIVEGSPPRQRHQDRRAAIEETAKRRRGAADAARYWDSLARHSRVGAEYLRSRGLGDVVGRDLVRFTVAGEPCVALLDRCGGVVNVKTRNLSGFGPKYLGRLGCSTVGTFVGHVTQVAGACEVWLVEGVADALTAVLAAPDALVLGADSSGTLPTVAADVASSLPEGARFVTVQHRDYPGQKAVETAKQIAKNSGRRLEVLDVGAKDLNEAWARGWRPAAQVAVPEDAPASTETERALHTERTLGKHDSTNTTDRAAVDLTSGTTPDAS